MPRVAGGLCVPPSNSFNPAIPDTDIEPAAWNNTSQDIYGILTDSIATNGLSTVTTDIPMAGHTLTGIRDGASNQEPATYGQLQAQIAALQAQITAITTTNVPIGGYIFTSMKQGGTPPANFLIPNGQSLLKASYPDLWSYAQSNAVFYNGTSRPTGYEAYFIGNGSGASFNLPNVVGLYPRFGGASAGSSSGIGNRIHSQNLSHTHTWTMTSTNATRGPDGYYEGYNNGANWAFNPLPATVYGSNSASGGSEATPESLVFTILIRVI